MSGVRISVVTIEVSFPAWQGAVLELSNCSDNVTSIVKRNYMFLDFGVFLGRCAKRIQCVNSFLGALS